MTVELQLRQLRRSAPRRLLEATLVGVGLRLGYREYDSPVGRVAVLFNPRGVVKVTLVDDLDRLQPGPIPAIPPWDAEIGRAIERGAPGDLPLDLAGLTPFQRRVLDTAAEIPRGEVRPYRWVARRIGNEGAFRAVGSSLARNPVPLIIPCHRVVRSDGRVGGYSLGGPDRKVLLLRHEGADLAGLEALAARGVRVVGSPTTGVFCVPGCRTARQTAPAHLVAWSDPKEALAAGFRPCRLCHPI